MALKFSEFVTSDQKELEGVWCDIGQGARLLIARAGNPDHEAEVARLEREYRSQSMASDGELPPDVRREIAIRAMAKTLLRGWEGLVLDDGLPFPPYTVEEGEKTLRAARDFRNLVSNLSMDRRRYQDAQNGNTLGNSSALSTGD